MFRNLASLEEEEEQTSTPRSSDNLGTRGFKLYLGVTPFGRPWNINWDQIHPLIQQHHPIELEYKHIQVNLLKQLPKQHQKINR